MRKLAISAAALLALAGCAHKVDTAQPQVSRAGDAVRKPAAKAATVEQPTPNQAVKKRWLPKFRVQWLHK